MLDKIFGTKTAALVLLHLFHYGDVHARRLARDIAISLSSIQGQLKKFEEAGLVVSKKIGTTRIFFFNKKSPLVRPLLDLLKVIYSSMSIDDKELLFNKRKRSRRAGKPIIGRGDK
ncbi:hypothetical protein A2619_00885 [candidate division WWE3 bacterium RIFOXYD1_FULL_39_9]|uniref:HTH arsR-type domain-containing protein n=1 Tax=candidate division WWE3 bacterium RIFOXYD1_FULL_39_9 TaxID=1802649 RepID=A0A1F4X4A9_UNCKA|nr:MAG: hypothetical protein A2619_00885 [candidate division WWE3 bacterium RIFOXYD1_FULL_39_9]